jgi:hypothetical protein
MQGAAEKRYRHIDELWARDFSQDAPFNHLITERNPLPYYPLADW